MTEETQITSTVKETLPAVVSITVSKYLTVFEKPFRTSGFRGPGGPGSFFAVPKGTKKVKVGGGSGFIADSSGIILTNRHVVEDPKAEYIVILNDNKKKYKAKILARDQINDIAIIKIEAENLPTLKLGDSSDLKLGQSVIAIGNTLGLFQNTVSRGVISGLSRNITAVNARKKTTKRLKDLIQTDAAVNPGNSGGPLVDIKGKVVGINAAMVHGAENVGFALPINSAKKDLEEVKKHGRILQPFLGIRYVPITKKLKKHYDLPVKQGALVVSEPVPEGEAIIPGSPADKAGLKEGDIILEIGDQKITPNNSLMSCLHDCKVGKEIKIKILRENTKKTLKATPVEKK